MFRPFPHIRILSSFFRAASPAVHDPKQVRKNSSFPWESQYESLIDPFLALPLGRQDSSVLLRSRQTLPLTCAKLRLGRIAKQFSHRSG